MHQENGQNTPPLTTTVATADAKCNIDPEYGGCMPICKTHKCDGDKCVCPEPGKATVATLGEQPTRLNGFLENVERLRQKQKSGYPMAVMALEDIAAADEIKRLRAKVDGLRIVVMNAQTALGAGDILPHDEHVLAKRITSARRALSG